MNNKNYMLSLLILFFAINYCPAQETVPLSITHGPYLQNVTETEATFVFTTNKLVVPGVMVKSDNGKFELIKNSHDGLINVGDNIHKVRLDNLISGQQYEYKLFACEILEYHPYKCTYGDTVFSKIFSFRTFDPKEKQLNFTVFNDVHDRAGKLGKYLDSNDIGKQVCYFLNGDIMGHIEKEEQLFSSFLDTCVSRFATGKPFFYTRGNHETRGRFARQLKKYLDLPDDKYYYGLTLGPVRFVVLDGGEDKPDNNIEYSGLADFDKYRIEELRWLKKEVASDEFKNARLKVVVVHMPIIKNGKNRHGMAFLAEHFGPVLSDAGIDLMISGHTHRNAWITEEDSGFGYPVMISSNNNYIEAVATKGEILLQLKDLDGKVVEIYTVTN